MGLLRALADAVIVGAGTLRAVPHHLWTPDHIFPPMAQAYRQLREDLGKPGQPLNVLVTASGDLDPSLPVFSSGQVTCLVVTNSKGLAKLRQAGMPDSVQIEATANSGPVTASAVIQAVGRIRETKTVLVEGGPQLIADFFAEDLLHDLFLTLAPQLAGRTHQVPRPALIEGKQFAPEQPKWGRLVSVRKANDHLFLRYAFHSV
jgi:riboflavin biosynthesis pyrimidine reductase